MSKIDLCQHCGGKHPTNYCQYKRKRANCYLCGRTVTEHLSNCPFASYKEQTKPFKREKEIDWRREIFA